MWLQRPVPFSVSPSDKNFTIHFTLLSRLMMGFLSRFFSVSDDLHSSKTVSGIEQEEETYACAGYVYH
jgi:hypothetical protein